MGCWVDLVMTYLITSLMLAAMFLGWALLMWKEIKLKKWQDYTLSAIMVSLIGWLVYLTFSS